MLKDFRTGDVLHRVTARPTHAERHVVELARLDLGADRVLKILAEATAEGALAAQPEPTVMVRMQDFPAPVARYTGASATSLLALLRLGTPYTLPLGPGVTVTRAKATPADQVRVMCTFARKERGRLSALLARKSGVTEEERERSTRLNDALAYPGADAGADLTPDDDWLPVFNALLELGYAIAAPDAVRRMYWTRKGLVASVKGPSDHIVGLALDLSNTTAATTHPALGAPAPEVEHWWRDTHGAPARLVYDHHRLDAYIRPEGKNNCLHVETRAVRAFPALGASGPAPVHVEAAVAPAEKPKGASKPKLERAPVADAPFPTVAPGAPAFRIPDTDGRRHIEVGIAGHERMIVQVAPTTLAPAENPRGDNRRFRVVVFCHGNFSDKIDPKTGKLVRPKEYRNADSLWVEKKVDAVLARMTNAGHNIVFAMLEDARNGLGGWYWNVWKDPAMLVQALDKITGYCREVVPGAELEGVTLVSHSGGGKPVLNGWLRDASVRSRLSEDDGECVFLDSHYNDPAGAQKYIAGGGRTTFVWRKNATMNLRDKVTKTWILDEKGKKKVFTETVRQNCEALAAWTHARSAGTYRSPDGKTLEYDRIVDGKDVFLPSTLDHRRISLEWETFLPHLFRVGEALYGTPILNSVTPLAAADAAPEPHGVCGGHFLGDHAVADTSEVDETHATGPDEPALSESGEAPDESGEELVA